MIGDLFLEEIFFKKNILIRLLKIHSVLAFLANVDRIFSPFDSKQFVEKFSIVYSPNLHKLAR